VQIEQGSATCGKESIPQKRESYLKIDTSNKNGKRCHLLIANIKSVYFFGIVLIHLCALFNFV
jgi:hypothetical protein